MGTVLVSTAVLAATGGETPLVGVAASFGVLVLGGGLIALASRRRARRGR